MRHPRAQRADSSLRFGMTSFGLGCATQRHKEQIPQQASDRSAEALRRPKA